jgi:hypothetical protein
MPNTMTMYTRDLAIRALFTPDDVDVIGGLQVALTQTIAPNNADITQLNEPTDDLYERQDYGLGIAYWAPTGFGSLFSTQDVVWETVLADSWGLMDPFSQQVINTGAINSPYEASTGVTPRLPAGSMVVGFSDVG